MAREDLLVGAIILTMITISKMREKKLVAVGVVMPLKVTIGVIEEEEMMMICNHPTQIEVAIEAVEEVEEEAIEVVEVVMEIVHQ